MHQHFLWSGLFFYAICLYYKSPKFWFRMFRISQDIYTAKLNFLNFFLTVKLSTFIYLFTLFFKLYPIPMDMHNFKYIYIHYHSQADLMTKTYMWEFFRKTWNTYRHVCFVTLFDVTYPLSGAKRVFVFTPRIDEHAYGTFYATLVL